jgi:diaminopimelate decarboxylase
MPDVNAPAYGASGDADDAVGAVLDGRRLDLIGLQCEIGSREHDFISYPAAIGHMIAAMTHIRERHDVVLGRLVLGGGRAVPAGDWAVQLPKLASEIDESLDDACATLRFPRPRVGVSAGLAILGQEAA